MLTNEYLESRRAYAVKRMHEEAANGTTNDVNHWRGYRDAVLACHEGMTGEDVSERISYAYERLDRACRKSSAADVPYWRGYKDSLAMIAKEAKKDA